jgi:hypothetical protein
VLLSFSDSAENRQKTDGAFAEGLWIANPEAVDVLRAYLAVLDRLPDAGGLAHWAAAREAGLGQSSWWAASCPPAEFGARFGGCPTATSWSSSTAPRGPRGRRGPGRLTASSTPGSTPGRGGARLRGQRRDERQGDGLVEDGILSLTRPRRRAGGFPAKPFTREVRPDAHENQGEFPARPGAGKNRAATAFFLCAPGAGGIYAP